MSEESNTLNQLNQIKKVLKLFDIAEDLKGKIENFGEELAIGVIETYGEKLGEKLAGKMGKYAVKGAVYTYKSKEDIAEIYKAGTCLHGDHFDMTSEKECVIERIENIREKALEKTKEKVKGMLSPNISYKFVPENFNPCYSTPLSNSLRRKTKYSTPYLKM